METLSHILASFDIFQVFISAFPLVITPLAHALQAMFTMLSDLAKNQFAAHPGLYSGTIIFFILYMSSTVVSRLKQRIVSSRPAFQTSSHHLAGKP